LLRLADASHIDGSRAPGFLQALRKPDGLSDLHWTFQSHLNQPLKHDGRLTYTSGHAFTLDEAEAWWLGLDILRMIDSELRQVDSLLTDIADAKVPRFAVNGVNSVEDPIRMCEHIPTEGWIPVDTHLRVTDVVSLVQKLGGKELYGNNTDAPLRELIQNATDAVRARRYRQKGLSKSQCNVYVCLGEDEYGHWLEVADNGIGMSADLMTSSLLDFGNSYWKSELMRQEHPGLLASGFQSTGKYGIGFFSVFMLGNRVHVTSRRFEQAISDTKVLEFNNGLSSRPILRNATADEYIHDGGTRVRIWLNQYPDEDIHKYRGILPTRDWIKMATSLPAHEKKRKLKELCIHLCPGIDSNLYIGTPDENISELVISASDWVDLDDEQLLDRLYPDFFQNKFRKKFSSNIKDLKNSNGELVGRACILPIPYRISYWGEEYEELSLLLKGFMKSEDSEANFIFTPNNRGAVITVGGLRAEVPGAGQIAGLLIGFPTRAARDQAKSIAERSAFSKWATEQAKLAYNVISDPLVLNIFAQDVLSYEGDPDNLPLAYCKHGWLNKADLVLWSTSFHDIVVIDAEDLGEHLESITEAKKEKTQKFFLDIRR